MNTFSRTHHPKRGLKPLVVAIALSLPCLTVSAANDGVTTRADQNVDQQYGRDSVYAFSTAAKPLSPERISGSRSIDDSSLGADEQAMSQPSTGSFSQPASDVALAGEAKGEWVDEYVVVMPAELATLEPAIEDGTATQYNRGYYAEPEQVIVAATDDSTADEFDRGYYKDPDHIAILVINPSNPAEEDLSSSLNEESMSATME